MTPKTVAIIFGFTEGEWHGKRFRRHLREAGYEVIKKAADADIIIAHSGGCYYVPRDLTTTQQVMLIDPPYWPARTIVRRGNNMLLHMTLQVRPGNEPFYQVHKTARNIAYLVRHARTNLAMMRHARVFNLADNIAHPHTILVHNEEDPWLTPDLAHLKRINPYLRIHHLPGGHDDCWWHPEHYINLLQSDS
ncbi:MAG TPA: alpha/beta hydrolase [Candidatus Saccharimonadales bacterium]|nr:alpha/beta hydrolase [Candidatus Saccharimonadales bacterium]